LLSWNVQYHFNLIRPTSPPLCLCTFNCCYRSCICSVPTRSTWSMSVDDYQSYWLKGSSPFMDIAVYSDTWDKYYRCIGFIQTIIIKFSIVIRSCKHSYPLTLIIKPEMNFLEILCTLMTFIAVKYTETTSEIWKCSLFECSMKQLPYNFVIGLLIVMPYILAYFAVCICFIMSK
jgi:hypothetical protein